MAGDGHCTDVNGASVQPSEGQQHGMKMTVQAEQMKVCMLKSLLLYASSSFKSHIILMGWGRERGVQQQNYNTGRWRGARAAPSGESQPPAPAAALQPWPPQPAPPRSPLSAPGAPGSAAEPQPSQSLSGSRFQRRLGPGRRQPPPRQIPQSPDPDSRRRGRAARPGVEGGGGGEAGRRVATAPGGFFPRRIL